MFSKQDFDLLLNFIDAKCSIEELCMAYDTTYQKFTELLLDLHSADLKEVLIASNPVKSSAENIPYVNTLNTAFNDALNVLYVHGGALSRVDLGRRIQGERSVPANTKYGELRSILLVLTGLCVEELCADGKKGVKISNYGKFLVSSNFSREAVFNKLLLRIPIIATVLKDSMMWPVEVSDYLFCLTEKTAYRRISAVAFMLKNVLEDNFGIKQYVRDITINGKSLI